MDGRNYTIITEFILVGFSEFINLQLLLFIMFLLMYIITLLGNLSIILAYTLTTILNTPMYLFLSNFSFLEICYVTSTVPKLLSNLLAGDKTIYFYSCALQMFCVLLLGGTECYMLAAMAYDRYIAICHPLLYSTIMSNKVCIQLIGGSWLIGAVNSLTHTTLTFNLPFCNDHTINHFFCDVPPLLKLACTDTWINQTVIFIVAGGVIVGSLILTIISYTFIMSAILTIQSRRHKAFSTCSSHFTVITIFYGSSIIMYFRPNTKDVMYLEKLVSLMYTIIVPLLNPFIYSLRNNDVKLSIQHSLSLIISVHKN
ncbi:olfactory receptor 5G9-like [Pelobates fuscus]|uniref:olfactory receptor 5G9-like n=1 Tax=Pelobates fuscus TaxID=191477 RepID=UPI002FE47101